MFISQKNNGEENNNDQEEKIDYGFNDILDVIRIVEDPDLGISIVDMGLIYRAEYKDGKIDVDMTLTSPGCPYGGQIISEVNCVLKSMKGVDDVNIEIVWDPPWTMECMSEDIRLEMGLD